MSSTVSGMEWKKVFAINGAFLIDIGLELLGVVGSINLVESVYNL